MGNIFNKEMMSVTSKNTAVFFQATGKCCMARHRPDAPYRKIHGREHQNKKNQINLFAVGINCAATSIFLTRFASVASINCSASVEQAFTQAGSPSHKSHLVGFALASSHLMAPKGHINTHALHPMHRS
jgi:hypothetical protein